MTQLPKLIRAQELAEILDEHLATIRKNTRRGLYRDFAMNLGTDQRPKWRYDTGRLAKWLDNRMQ